MNSLVNIQITRPFDVALYDTRGLFDVVRASAPRGEITPGEAFLLCLRANSARSSSYGSLGAGQEALAWCALRRCRTGVGKQALEGESGGSDHEEVCAEGGWGDVDAFEGWG